MAKVLVVGGGIGGEALAVLLGRGGWDVVVAEIAPALRSGGQTVDLRGPSAEVLNRLGLLEDCRRRLVPQQGIAWVAADGQRLAEMPVSAFAGQGLVSYDELLRADLARLLHEAAGPHVEHRFSETVEHIDTTADAARVVFRSGGVETFDLVVGADGAHSQVRSLAFGPEQQFRSPLGLAHAWYTLHEQPTTPGLDGWYLVHNAAGSRAVEARPGRPGEQEIGLTFAATALPDRRDRAGQQALLRSTFAGMGWRTPELLAGAGVGADFALDTFDQIRVERWHRDRVVLLGDSAWCSSPLSGLGTALALLGAHVLAELLLVRGTTRATLEATLLRYQEVLQPRAASAQRLPPGRVRSFAPRTDSGIRAATTVYRTLQTRPVEALLTRLMARTAHAPGLPHLGV